MANYIKNKKDRKALKGISIATICLSSLSIWIALIGIFYIVLAFGLVHISDIALDIAGNTPLGLNASIDNENLIIGDSVNNIYELFNIGLGLVLSFTIFSLLTSGFALAISIITLNALTKRKYPENIFILNLFSAILSLISINIIRCIVTFIGCYFVNKIKN